jgi:hypothetical protein
MALLKRKAEKTDILSIRIPLSVKDQIEMLRQLADAQGFDLTGSLSDVVIKWVRQVSEELQGSPAAVHKAQSGNGAEPSIHEGERRADK